MENNGLKKTWKNIGTGIELKSTTELKDILKGKTRKVIFQFYISRVANLLIATGFLGFLIYAAIVRWDDMYYRVNNMAVGLFTLIALLSELFHLYLLQKYKLSFSLKEWIEKNISIVSKELKQRVSYYIFPIIIVPSLLSIHVFYSDYSLANIMYNEETLFGLMAGFIAALVVGCTFIAKYRKYQLRNLKYLEDLYDRLCNEG